MKLKLGFKTFYNLFLAGLLVMLVWSVWSSFAQTTNDAKEIAVVVAVKTNNVAGVTALGPIVPHGNVTPKWIDNLAGQFPFLKHELWGNEAWKYIASLIYIFLAFYISKFLDYLTRVWLKRWAEKTETKFDDLILDLLNGPVKVVAFVIFLHIGLGVFQWPDAVQNILVKGFTVIVACTLTYMVLKFVDLLMGYWRQRTAIAAEKAFNEQLFPIVRKSLKAFVVIVAVLITSQNLGINVTAALASLSIGGLAIGLAAQDTLANLFGAVSVFMDKPFLVGERIQIDQVEGNVESIGLRSTRVRNAKGFLVTIPNKTVGNATITNITRRPTIQTEMNIGITYDTSAEKVRLALKLINEIYRSNSKTGDLVVSFNRFADSALNILVVHFWNGSDYKEYLSGMQEMNLTLKERFDKEKIGFAFPSQTLYIKQDSDWRLAHGGEEQKLLPEAAGPKAQI